MPFTEWYKVWVVYFSLVAVLTRLILAFSSIDENYKLKNLFAKVGNVLTFLFLAFFNRE